jgi:hypothetical protein
MTSWPKAMWWRLDGVARASIEETVWVLRQPDGKCISNGMVFVRVDGGKLVEGWNNFDQLGMLQQLGVVNVPSTG